VRTLIFILLLVIILSAAGAATLVYRRIMEPFKGYQSAEQFVDIMQGSSTRTIGRQLIDAGVVRNDLTFRAALWRTGLARELKAGEYRFDSPMTPVAVIEKIARGDGYVRRLTFPEGLTIPEMARIFEAQGFGPAQTFVDAAKDVSLIADRDREADDLEGYLFPETYTLPRRTSAERLVALMVERFTEVFTPELRQAAAARDLTVRQAVTLASIVEKETGQPSERPIVAAVYRNRLQIGMGLQCDPTVIYALQRAGRYKGNLTRDDLSFDSPYNTYRYAGLPPGPIAAPGRASLEAAVRPADVGYLYFVSRNDGSHVFARTLAEHNANVRRFQVMYFRQRR
jgi:UPF0755 protein